MFRSITLLLKNLVQMKVVRCHDLIFRICITQRIKRVTWQNKRALSLFYLLGISAFSRILNNFYHRVPSRIWVVKSIKQRSTWNISKLRMGGYYGASIHGNWQTLWKKAKSLILKVNVSSLQFPFIHKTPADPLKIQNHAVLKNQKWFTCISNTFQQEENPPN